MGFVSCTVTVVGVCAAESALRVGGGGGDLSSVPGVKTITSQGIQQGDESGGTAGRWVLGEKRPSPPVVVTGWLSFGWLWGRFLRFYVANVKCRARRAIRRKRERCLPYIRIVYLML